MIKDHLTSDGNVAKCSQRQALTSFSSMISGVHFPRRAILGKPTNDTVASFKGTCSILHFLWSEESNPKAVSFRLGIIIQEEAQFAGGFHGYHLKL